MDNTLLERLNRINIPAHKLADAKAQALKAEAFVDFVMGLRDHSRTRERRFNRYVTAIRRHFKRGYRPA